MSNNKTALVIKGARQVGKTTMILDFARKEYENVVYINFHTMPSLIKLFDEDIDTYTLISKISASTYFNFVPHKTVIIFDEIQMCPMARSSFKAFCLDGRFDVIVTGSLLGVSKFNKNTNFNVPSECETHLTMYAMDFREYLWALEFDKNILEQVEKNFTNVQPIDKDIHNKLFKHHLDYLIVGGMPKVVARFAETKDFNIVREEQQIILNKYQDDFGKYTNSQGRIVVNNRDAIKLKKIFDSIPTQLAKEEHINIPNSSTKFRFNELSHGGKFRNYADAIEWLSEAGVINVCHNTSNIAVPMNEYNIENQLKIYLNDTGLLIACLDKQVTAALYKEKGFKYKGYIYECLIADALSKNGFNLYYNSLNSRLEVDFILSTAKDIFAIEVRSSKNNPSALKKVLSDHRDVKCIKLSTNNIVYANGILTMPYYLAYLIDEDFMFPNIG